MMVQVEQNIVEKQPDVSVFIVFSWIVRVRVRFLFYATSLSFLDVSAASILA
jgi:hypothetical protein